MGESNFSVKWFAFFARLRGKPKSHTQKKRESEQKKVESEQISELIIRNFR
jgi:hypothetical protein